MALALRLTIKMIRFQVPLAPEAVRTVQTAQGLTMDAAVMMLQSLGSGMSDDDWWMHLYVMLSRVRTTKQILVYDLPPKQMFERGPPKWVKEGIDRLIRAAATQSEVAVRARAHLGWEARAFSASSRARAQTRAAAR